MLNAGKPPFDNLNARLAVAHATDRNALNQLTNNEVSQTWDQPFAPQTLGYQKDPGFPTYDPKKAEEFVNKYKQETGQSELTLHARLDARPGHAAAGGGGQVPGREGARDHGRVRPADRTEPVHQPGHRRRLPGDPVAQLPGRRPRHAVRLVAEPAAEPQHRASWRTTW